MGTFGGYFSGCRAVQRMPRRSADAAPLGRRRAVRGLRQPRSAGRRPASPAAGAFPGRGTAAGAPIPRALTGPKIRPRHKE